MDYLKKINVNSVDEFLKYLLEGYQWDQFIINEDIFDNLEHDLSSLEDSPLKDYALGCFYYSLDEDDIRFLKAIDYFCTATIEGPIGANYCYASCLLDSRFGYTNPSLALHYYEIAAKEKYPPAIYQLGLCYLNERGVDVDYKKVMQYFDECIQYDYYLVYYTLGRCYYFGFGVHQDLKKAFSYFMEYEKRLKLSKN